ncbi:hypothetical protein PRZ48_004631 [Zasmidium cellare]|uniref:Rhodopsin domain-containing protein n=1 Tax=Zasmidium cellare TaxID=395010 RepID=A0ABR0EQ36_ZASCE|nr:hypothetical protein PRZ48_004631 [Zasmidium cellare]
MLDERALWGTAPPEPRSRLENWPTVLFSWWCTSFAAVIIITRLCGRKVRSNRLFREDWIMMISLIPLFIRMIFIHFVLIYGTNNIETAGHTYSPTKIYHKEIGSRLVLAARIFYAMFIWISKLTVSEFLKRITIRVWRRSWEIMLQIIRIFLFLTFAGVVVATLTECQPFDHYWQVVPDPGPHCRQGFAQLLTMGVCDIITDILLIAFPIPVVLNSGQSWQRKLQMTLLFSMSIIMIGITATRMPMVIDHRGRQQYRTVWASCEILASASVSNAVILGSFLRDKGTKKNKYKTFSVSDSIDRVSTRRPTLVALQTIDSDEDLFRTLAGGRLPDHLQHKKATSPRPAPPALPAPQSPLRGPSERVRSPIDARIEEGSSNGSEDSLHKPHIHQVIPPSPSTTRSVSFFDVGNLLDHNDRSKGVTRPGAIDEEVGPHIVLSQDFASASRHHHSRSEARAFLRDVGERLRVRGEGHDRSASPRASHSRSRSRNPPMGVPSPRLERQDTQMSLQDAGGLLGPAEVYNMTPAISTPQQSDAGPRRPYGSAPANGNSWEDDIELDDIGGLLSHERTMDRTAVSLQEILNRSRSERAASSPLPSSQEEPDDMILHDPGGLMKS